MAERAAGGRTGGTGLGRALSHHLVFAVALVVITAGSVYSDWLIRLDLLIHDAEQQLHIRPPPDDIVIVGVDEYSLSRLGRWPWPRELHARLLDRLTEAGARAVVLDIIFAEPNLADREGDRVLAAAIARNGRVFLPVVFEQRYNGGQLIETLPLPEFIAGARAIGHAHVELDIDGITRSVYLREGLGDAYWPHLSVALLDDLGGLPDPLPGSRNGYAGPPRVDTLRRDNHVLIPYAGPPGHFHQISFAKVLGDEATARSLEGKIVFIGATASGLGDLLPTPVSALSHPMSGVEINANIFDALRSGLIVDPLSATERMALSLAIVLLPVVLFPRLSPRSALLMSAALLVGTLALSSLLLARFHIWFPPAAALLGLVVAYPLWSWRRLEYANRFLSQELQRLDNEPGLQPAREFDLESAMAFARQLVPVTAWSLYHTPDHLVAHWQRPLPYPKRESAPPGNQSWHPIQRDRHTWWLGVELRHEREPEPQELALLLDIVLPLIEQRTPPSTTAIELFEERIMKVQQAEQRLRAMRRFLDDALNQMANGVVVVDNLGRITFINGRALDYLDLPRSEALGGPALALLDTIDIEGPGHWPRLLERALLHNEPAQAQGMSAGGVDLMIQLSPLCLEGRHVNGVIVNLADISHLRAIERQRLETFSFLSHDLRAPLTSILALVEVTRQQGEEALDPALLERIENYVRRTLTLTEDFLQLSQLEHMVELDFRTVDLALVAANAIDAVWDLSSARDIEIVDELPEEPVYVRGDPNLLERALLNLLSNAIKYSPEGSAVTVTLVTEGGWAECQVRDRGFGIPPQLREKIFDRYFRIEEGAHAGSSGSGLGLSFVKSVVERHGGSIRVESEPGRGSCFCLRLEHVSDEKAL